MKKKLAIIIILVIAAATLFGGIAYAADRLPHPQETRVLVIGEVVEVRDDYLMISLPNGVEINLFIDDRTNLHFHDGSEASLGDVQVGHWVGSSTIRISRENWLAREILLFPSGYEPPLDAKHARGRVIEVGPESFKMNTKEGSTILISIDTDTVFLCQIQGLEDFEAGMIAGIHGYETDQGTITAHTLWVHYPIVRMVGIIRGIDLEENILTLKRRNGVMEEVSVNDETKVRSREDSIQDLADLEEGMAALIHAIQLGNQSFLVKQIIVFDLDQLPEFDIRILGKVKSVSFDLISVETRSGNIVRFQVTEQTKFRSRGQTKGSIRDISPGMWVGVGGKSLDDDELLAEEILIFHSKP